MNNGTLIARKRGLEASIRSLTEQVFSETNERKAKAAWDALKAQEARLERVKQEMAGKKDPCDSTA